MIMVNLALAPTPRAAKATLMRRVTAVARTWWHSYRLKRRQRATVRMLHGLDDRMLKDIGLARNEIESVVATKCAGRRLRCVDLDGVIPPG
jgi:uncharacterized protein YjiS (DUF1127 family)